MPLIERVLDKLQFSLADRVFFDVDAAALQAAHYICGEDECVLAHIAQYTLSRHAAESAALRLHQCEQTDQVLLGPARNEFSETPVRLRDVKNELSIRLHTQHFLAVADDAGVARKTIDLLGAEHDDPVRGKAKKNIFKIRPLVIDHPPHKTRLENTASHLRQPPVVLARGQRLCAAQRRHQALNSGGATVALAGALMNVGKMFQLVAAAAVTQWRVPTVTDPVCKQYVAG